MAKREPQKPKILNSELHLTAQPMGVFRYRANPKADTPFTDILDPAYWENVQQDKFKVAQDHHNGQIVEVYPEGGAYYAELLVERLNNGGISIKKLKYWDLNQDQPKLKRDDFRIENRGKEKWCVIRQDGIIIERHHNTQQEAEAVLTKMIA